VPASGPAQPSSVAAGRPPHTRCAFRSRPPLAPACEPRPCRGCSERRCGGAVRGTAVPVSGAAEPFCTSPPEMRSHPAPEPRPCRGRSGRRAAARRAGGTGAVPGVATGAPSRPLCAFRSRPPLAPRANRARAAAVRSGGAAAEGTIAGGSGRRNNVLRVRQLGDHMSELPDAGFLTNLSMGDDPRVSLPASCKQKCTPTTTISLNGQIKLKA
jgi:hypothetical protein